MFAMSSTVMVLLQPGRAESWKMRLCEKVANESPPPPLHEPPMTSSGTVVLLQACSGTNSTDAGSKQLPMSPLPGHEAPVSPVIAMLTSVGGDCAQFLFSSWKDNVWFWHPWASDVTRILSSPAAWSHWPTSVSLPSLTSIWPVGVCGPASPESMIVGLKTSAKSGTEVEKVSVRLFLSEGHGESCESLAPVMTGFRTNKGAASPAAAPHCAGTVFRSASIRRRGITRSRS